MALLQGGIVIWSGSTLDIPNGWQLCDGTNGTPDLRNRFIIGAGDIYAVGNTGGSADSIIPEHTHTGVTNSTGAHTHSFTANWNPTLTNAYNGSNGSFNVPTTINGSHTHTGTLEATGESGTGKNLPPYYALCYIQQL